MDIVWMDGFDTYKDNSQFLKNYRYTNSPAWYETAGRFGGGAILNNAYNDTIMIQDPTNNDFMMAGGAFKFKYDDQYQVIFSNHNTSSFNYNDFGICLVLVNDGSFRIYNDGRSVVATSEPGIIQIGQWYYIELSFGRITGEAKVWVNGVEVIHTTGQDFNDGSGASYWYIGSFSSWLNNVDYYYDDIYFASSPDTFLTAFGDVVIERLKVAGEGNNTGFTGVYTDVQTDDDDTTKITGTNVGDKATYTMDQITGDYNVKGVKVMASISKEDAGMAQAKILVDTNGSEVEGGRIIPSESGYSIKFDTYAKNPVTGVDWTVAEVNALKVGVKVTG